MFSPSHIKPLSKPKPLLDISRRTSRDGLPVPTIKNINIKRQGWGKGSDLSESEDRDHGRKEGGGTRGREKGGVGGREGKREIRRKLITSEKVIGSVRTSNPSDHHLYPGRIILVLRRRPLVPRPLVRLTSLVHNPWDLSVRRPAGYTVGHGVSEKTYRWYCLS